MIKQSKTFIVLFFACITLITSVVYYQPFTYLERVRQKHEALDEARAGIRQGIGLPPSEYGRGMGYFTLTDLTLHIPREYIYYKPNQPNGKVKNLSLNFFLPKMQSRSIMEQAYIKIMSQSELLEFLHSLQIDVSLSPKNNHIQCLESHCLNPAFALFQKSLANSNGFENHIEKDRQDPKSVQSLKNGQYDAHLNLIVYRSASKPIDKEEINADMLYLKPDVDSSNPGEWIYCSGYGCHLNWFRDGLRIYTHYARDLLPYHTIIRERIDQKLDTFI